MNRRKFIAGLMASAAAIPVGAALPAVQAEANWFGVVGTDLSKASVWKISWSAGPKIYPKGSIGGLDFGLPVTRWRNCVEENDFRSEIIDDIPYKEIAYDDHGALDG